MKANGKWFIGIMNTLCTRLNLKTKKRIAAFISVEQRDEA